MQAIRVDRQRTFQLRWLHHLVLLGTLAFLFTWMVTTHPPVVPASAARPSIGFLSPPCAPAQEWLPVRVPVRTSVTPDPPAPMAVVPPGVHEATVAVLPAAERTVIGTVSRVEQWVQAHRRSALHSAPEDGAANEIEVPQWSYLRVLETGNGWLRVAYGGDADGSPVTTAWVSVADIGVSGPPPRFVMARSDLPLWDAPGAASNRLSTAPHLATFQLAGPEQDGRLAVRLDCGVSPAIGWVDREAVALAPPPVARDVPLAEAYSPFRAEVRLDVPYRSQLDGSLSALSNCGPSSVAMVLEAFGVWVPTAGARALALRQMGVSSPFTGTTLESLRSVAEAHGLVGLGLHENGRYRRWTLDDVRRHLRAGQPVIPQLRYRMMPGRGWTWTTTDHYVVISGLVGDDFVIDDPIPEGGQGERLIGAADLDRAWRSSDFPYAGFAVARPD